MRLDSPMKVENQPRCSIERFLSARNTQQSISAFRNASIREGISMNPTASLLCRDSADVAPCVEKCGEIRL